MKRHKHVHNKRSNFKLLKAKDWLRLFPQEIKRGRIMDKVRPKIERKIKEQRDTYSQLIGKIREEKVIFALEHLKQQAKIRDYFQSGKWSYANLIEGIDFVFIYIENTYHVCFFSVTGPRWVKEHLERHPQIPVVSISLKESRRSIEKKILNLRKLDQGI